MGNSIQKNIGLVIVAARAVHPGLQFVQVITAVAVLGRAGLFFIGSKKS